MPTGNSAPKIVTCPRCQAPVEWSAKSPYRPFCSERCKLMDLGAWAEEKYAIPDNEPAEDEFGEAASTPERHNKD